MLAQRGDRGAENHVFALVYDKLRATARTLLSHERRGHTLQSAALVSEAFLKKLRSISTPIQNREHYYSLAALAMRQVLIDHSRRHGATRRHLTAETVAELLMRTENPYVTSEEWLAAEQVLAAMEALDADAAECIRLRFIHGLTIQETAQRVGRPVWRVRDECDFGLSWMARRLGCSR